jgi:ABC-type taurine transport system ATPase subunit
MLYGVLSGVENLDYFAALATGRRLPRERLLAFLAEAGLDAGAADKRVATYSKWMRQKVGIAIASAIQHKFLGRSHAELATEHGITRSAVEKHLIRALVSLRAAMLKVSGAFIRVCL